MSSNPEIPESKRCGGRRCWRVPFIVLGVVLIKGAVAWLLWNALIPELFHGPVLSFFQAVGLVILAKVLFGHGLRPHHGRFGPPWRRWDGLSPEERAKLREEIAKRCE
jgi:hypothetical protein